MKTKIIITTAMLCLSINSFAGTWSYTDGAGGPVVVNGQRGEPGTTHVTVKNKRQGTRLAKKLNKIAEQDNANGFIDNGDCPENVLC